MVSLAIKTENGTWSLIELGCVTWETQDPPEAQPPLIYTPHWTNHPLTLNHRAATRKALKEV